MGDAGDIDVQGLQALGQGALSAIAAPADQKQQDAMQQGDLEQMQGITSVKRDGEKTTITGTNAMIDYLHKSLMEGAQLKHHVSQVEQVLQGELQKVQNRENAYNRSPILSALANIAGNMAQAPKMPGVVQALGRSSVQLNPGPLAIQGQKMNILEALDQAHRTSVADERAQFSQDIQTVSALHQIQTAEETAKRDQNTATAKMMSEFSTAAKNREFDPESAKAVALSVLGDPQKADALVSHFKQQQAKAEINDQMRQQIKDKEDLKKFDQQLRLTTAREDASIRKMMMGQSMRDEAQDSKAKAKEMEVPKTLPDKLQALDAAEKSLDNVEEVVKKYGGLMGAVYGRTAAPVAGYFSKDVSKAETNLKLEVAQAIKATGAGARGFGPQERGFFEKLATGFHKSPEENLGVVEAWRQYIRQQRGAYVDSYKGLSDEKYIPVFGKDKDLLDVKSVDARSAAKESLPPEAVKQLKEGVQTRFRNGQIWTLQKGDPVQVQ